MNFLFPKIEATAPSKVSHLLLGLAWTTCLKFRILTCKASFGSPAASGAAKKLLSRLLILTTLEHFHGLGL